MKHKDKMLEKEQEIKEEHNSDDENEDKEFDEGKNFASFSLLVNWLQTRISQNWLCVILFKFQLGRLKTPVNIGLWVWVLCMNVLISYHNILNNVLSM